MAKKTKKVFSAAHRRKLREAAQRRHAGKNKIVKGLEEAVEHATFSISTMANLSLAIDNLIKTIEAETARINAIYK